MNDTEKERGSGADLPPDDTIPDRGPSPTDTDSAIPDGAASPTDTDSAVPDAPRLSDQICFPLYACSRAVVKQYRPFLEPLGLTYTQYITMMLLWEKGTVTAREIGRCLYLDSGTLSPLLKRMEARGLLTRRRDPSDERDLLVTIAAGGEALRGPASAVPGKMAELSKLTPEEGAELYRILYKILT